MNIEQQAVDKAIKAINDLGGKGNLSQVEYRKLLKEHKMAEIVKACSDLKIEIATS